VDLTRENVNEVVDRHGFVGEIDSLSLDLDGVDYWIWQALTVVNPRVVVIEYLDILGPDRSRTEVEIEACFSHGKSATARDVGFQKWSTCPRSRSDKWRCQEPCRR
jgi:propanediol utilization protein